MVLFPTTDKMPLKGAGMVTWSGSCDIHFLNFGRMWIVADTSTQKINCLIRGMVRIMWTTF